MSLLATELDAPRDVAAVPMDRLLAALLELSSARTREAVVDAVRRSARDLTGADGVTFVVREGPLVHYLEENAIRPLWKGRRFPIECCISGWAILNRRPAVIENIYADERIPREAYEPTFVKSLAMVPIRAAEPLGAIGAYWGHHHRATAAEVATLEALASASATALENASLVQALEESVRARDEFLGIVAHELRTPLTPVLLKIDQAERVLEEGDPARARGSLRGAGDGVRRLARLVNAILDVSQAARDRLPLDPVQVDLAALAREVVARFAPDALRAGVPLALDAPAAIPVRCDRARVEQVLSELVSNALRFAEGRPVDVAVSDEGVRARLDVVDRGRGIAPEDQARIFERFERAVPSRHFGGLGLGLWLARRFVEAHGGEVRVESSRGAGSRFTVFLPR